MIFGLSLPADVLPAFVTWFVFLALLSIASVALGFALERSAFGQRNRVWTPAPWQGQYAFETRSAVRFTLLASMLFALATADLGLGAQGGALVVFGDTTWANGILSFVLPWGFFEVFYYVVHRALHTRRGVPFHRHHHRSVVGTPITGLSMGWLETLAWQVGYLTPVALMSFVMPVSLPVWFGFLVYHWGGNLLGHINVEIVGRPFGTRAWSWALHPFTYHALHHARWTGHYALYSTYFDRWFGTEWADWPELHERVVSGTPLSDKKVKGQQAPS